jgi:hypothetical protein
MVEGSNKSLFTLIAVVIFGVFLSLSYWLFQDELKSVLADVMESTSEMTSIKLENNGKLNTDEKYFKVTVTGESVTINEFIATKGEIKNVIIPAYIDGLPVTTIGVNAFRNKGIEKLTFPETLVKIMDGPAEGQGAFSGNKIKEIIFPDSLVYVGAEAFYGSNVEKVVLGENVTYLGPKAFKYNNISSVTFNDKLVMIDIQAFRFNAQLSIVNLPETVTSLGTLSFSMCGIKDFTVPKNVTSLGTRFIAGNPLESIKIPLTMQTKITNTPLILGKYAPPNLIMTPVEAATLYDSSLITYY